MWRAQVAGICGPHARPGPTGNRPYQKPDRFLLAEALHARIYAVPCGQGKCRPASWFLATSRSCQLDPLRSRPAGVACVLGSVPYKKKLSNCSAPHGKQAPHPRWRPRLLQSCEKALQASSSCGWAVLAANPSAVRADNPYPIVVVSDTIAAITMR